MASKKEIKKKIAARQAKIAKHEGKIKLTTIKPPDGGFSIHILAYCISSRRPCCT